MVWAHGVGRNRGLYGGTCSGPMWWDAFWACVVGLVQVHVGHVQGPCCETCQGRMLWDVVWAHGVGRNQGLYCGMCTGPMLGD